MFNMKSFTAPIRSALDKADAIDVKATLFQVKEHISEIKETTTKKCNEALESFKAEEKLTRAAEHTGKVVGSIPEMAGTALGKATGIFSGLGKLGKDFKKGFDSTRK